MTEKAPRNTKPLTLGKAVDALVAIVEVRRTAEREAFEAVRARFAKREQAIYDRVPEHLRSAAEKAVEAALDAARGPVIDADVDFFGVDREDSARLLELRQVIDDALGWETVEEEEAGDYVARVRQVGAKLRALVAALPPDRQFEDPGVDEPLPKGATDYQPGPVARQARGSR